MNYRHIYHAGNVGDVFKHIVLCYVLRAISIKGKPFRYMEIHAGAGCYDLTSTPAQKTGEYKKGIEKLWAVRHQSWDEGIAEYLTCVAQAQGTAAPDKETLQMYPGSPLIARHFLSAQDHLVLNDLSADIYAELRRLFGKYPNVHCHQKDAYQLLNALIPFPEKRGVILIDPSFEVDDEWITLPQHIARAYQKWPQGIFMCWYPIKDKTVSTRFHQSLVKEGIPKFLITELTTLADDIPQRLNGSGMVIINPPWRLEEALQAALPSLLAVLREDIQADTHTYTKLSN